MALQENRMRIILKDGFGGEEDKEFIIRTLRKIRNRQVSSLNLRERTVIVELFKEFMPLILLDTATLNKFRNFAKRTFKNKKITT